MRRFYPIEAAAVGRGLFRIAGSRHGPSDSLNAIPLFLFGREQAESARQQRFFVDTDRYRSAFSIASSA
jgi:hypothetical protein